jgi:quinone-modifying oxidoreductase subunit QmoA
VSHRGIQKRLLVVGGGIAGISAAIEAAEAGLAVVLVEQEPHLGGRVAQMHQYFTKLCPPACGMEINLRRIRTSPRITVHTSATVETVTGGPGRYQVRIRQAPRFVADCCSACGICASVCPVERPSRFDFGMKKTRAAYLAFPGAWPTKYTIDPFVCLGAPHPGPLPASGEREELPPRPAEQGEAGAQSAAGEGALCRLCADACPTHAIDLSAAPRTFDLDVAAVIWATGWQPYDPARLGDLGFGASPDVITNMMMERLASPHGPTEGKVLRPSDGRPPAAVAFVQCAGSRDDAHLRYCSGLCCMASAKQVRYVRAQHPDAEIYVFYIDRRAAGRQELFLADTEQDPKVHFIPGKVARISVDGGTPVLEVEDMAQARKRKQKVDLVVLATGMVPSPSARELDADRHGFLHRQPLSAGQLPAGCAREPMDVHTAVRDATGAVLRALGQGGGGV